jgi:hypothetical protein
VRYVFGYQRVAGGGGGWRRSACLYCLYCQQISTTLAPAIQARAPTRSHNSRHCVECVRFAYGSLIPELYQSSPFLKGIVSRDWERLQGIIYDGSEEYKIVGAYFYLFLTSVSCKKACFASFSFDSHSVSDEWQPQIILINRCCTCTIVSIGMLLPRCRCREWRQLLPDCLSYFTISAIRPITLHMLLQS